jgi:two-component system chemotaxis sensor kinase CheA
MLDKSVVDRIGDPLIHLVRNSVDHGIESSSSQRVASNKNETGKIELNAYHKGGNIYIEVKDDGRGLDKQTIFEKAKERGLAREGQVLSDREIFNFILLPGFSTASKLTEVSGRGVGMDVVKRAMDDLRGNIDIVSEEGTGTTFTLRLPLTLAIIDGMLVRIGAERYIIPTLSIVEAVRPDHDSITSLVNRGEMITIRDNIIPLFRLGTLFSITDARQNPAEGIVIVVEDSGKMAGILVDELLGQQSIVIKSMGATMKGLPGVSGGSILSDGRVGIIIDVAGIVKLAMSGGHAAA